MQEHSPIRAAIFDLGGVVVDICEQAIRRRWADTLGLSPEQLPDPFADDDRYQLLERGEMSIEEYYRHMVGRMGRAMSFEDFLAGWNSLVVGPVAEMEPLLARLKRSLRLLALSNTNVAHAAVWRPMCAEALRHFERVFVSYEMGLRKPAPECFDKVLAYLGLQPGRVVFIDDSPAHVAAARRVGMKGIVAQDPEQIARELGRLGVELEV